MRWQIIYFITTINETFLSELKSLNANLQVVVALECYQK
jgi:hypothetical protein